MNFLFGKKLISKHISVFILFLISGLFLRKIISLITKNKFHANLSSIFYLLYPYLLGHSFFNVKDIPFLTFLVNMYLFFNKNNKKLFNL